MSDVRVPERGMGRRLVLVLGLAAVVTAVAVATMLGVFSGAGPGSGAATPGAGAGSAPPPVAIVDEVVADGIAVPVRVAELAATAGGTVVDVPVVLGATVAAGEALVRLDTATIDAEIAGARAAVDAAAARAAQARALRTQADEQVGVAEAGLDQAEAALKTARDNNVREREAAAARTAARAQVRVARAAATAAAEGIVAAEADLRRAEAALASLERSRDRLAILAPFAGTVAGLPVREYAFVAPGQVVVRLADTSAWEFVATELDESGIAGVRQGARATVTLDGVPGVAIPGTVARLGSYGQDRQGGVVYEVVVVPDAAVPDGVRWNMTATIAIKVGG